jgi:preprotein translocase subunit YajC
MKNKKKLNKPTIKLIINVLMFLCMMAIAGIGFLMKYVLLSGIDKWEKYGRNFDMFFLGMDRHEWGKIHLIIAFVLLGLLILHIFLNWKILLGMFGKFIPQKIWRQALTIVFIVVCIFLAFSFLIINPEIQEFEQGMGRRRNINYNSEIAGSSEKAAKEEINEANKEIETRIKDKEYKVTEKIIETPDTHDSSIQTHEHQESSLDIRGFMTLYEVSEKYNVPVDYLKQQLGIPESVPNNGALGKLRRIYNFRMSDVRIIIENYHK